MSIKGWLITIGCCVFLISSGVTLAISEPAREQMPGWWWLARVGDKGFDATSVSRGHLSLHEGDLDTPFATASIDGSGRNAYARAQWELHWDRDTIYRTEASFYLPPDFYANQMGAVQLMGWDTWPIVDNQMRLIIWDSDRHARLFLKREGQDSLLTNAFTIPEGRWVQLAIEQKISDTDGWSKVYLDSALVAEGRGTTATPYPVTRMRYGLVATAGPIQRRPLSVYFSHVRLSVLLS